MNKKGLIFWFLTVIGFIGVVILSLYVGSVENKEKNITFDLDIEPGVFYRTGDHFAINDGPYNSVSFSYPSTINELTNYRFVQFTDVIADKLTKVRLQLLDGNEIIFEEDFVRGFDFLVPLSGFSKFFETDDKKLKLMVTVETNKELGFAIPQSQDMAFKALTLNSDSYLLRWKYLKSWFSNNINYEMSSLNYWQKQTFLEQTAWGIIVWSCVVLLSAFLLQIPFKHVLFFLIVVGLFFSFSFVKKQIELKRQMDVLFNQRDTEAINMVDSQISSFSSTLLSWINENEIKPFVVLVRLTDDFNNSRFRYYLHAVPVYSYASWPYIESFKERNNIETVFVIMSKEHMPNCLWGESLKMSQDFELVLKDNSFCAVKF